MAHSPKEANIRSATLDNSSFYGARNLISLFATARNWILSKAGKFITLFTPAHHWTLSKAG